MDAGTSAAAIGGAHAELVGCVSRVIDPEAWAARPEGLDAGILAQLTRRQEFSIVLARQILRERMGPDGGILGDGRLPANGREARVAMEVWQEMLKAPLRSPRR